MLLVTENAPADRRGFYGGFAQAGAPMGVVLANLAFLAVTASVSEEAFMSWGWRIPFIASLLLVGLALYVQLRLEDTPAFKELKAASEGKTEDTGPKSKSPILKALSTYPKQIVLAAGAFLSVQVSFYIFIVFIMSYGTDPDGLALSRTDMLTAVLISSFAQVPAIFLAASYSDRHGRRGIYKMGALAMAVWGFCVFPLMDTGSLLAITLALTVGQIFIGMMYGPQAALLTELFSTEVRYSGASLGYQLGAIVGGGMAPIAATALIAAFGSAIWVSAYIALASLLTWLSLHLLGENHQADLEKVA
jgi:MFS family permease